MWVRMVRAVVAGRAPRQVGEVVEVQEAEAQALILAGMAVESSAPPVEKETPPAPIETAEDPRPGVEHAVKRKGRGAQK